MKLSKETIRIGLEKPFKVLHISDTHLTCADERDDERKRALAEARHASFAAKGCGEMEAVLEQIAYANEHCDLLLHTGDLLDFVSYANIDTGRELLSRCKDFFMISGNHEFSRYVGEAWEDTAYKMSSYQQLRNGLGFDLLYLSRVFGGVNFVGIDNGYYNVEPWQLQRLQKEVEKGLPIVLCMHTPIFEEGLYAFSMNKHKHACAYLLGCDEEHLAEFTEYRAVQQRPTPETLRFIDYVLSQPLIKCVLAGHLHLPYTSALPGGLMQYVAGAGYKGYACEFTFV
ncbi:MAG: metallophosphoesterase [Eubacteriales bacterium]|nr:metallophosphoesterase [Eubacteriales bacterium]